MRWERFGDAWIEKRFVSKMDNIFILEKVEGGTELYCFDDGPEVPTASVVLLGEADQTLRSGIEVMARKGEQAVCEFLFSYFPDLQAYWNNTYGQL
jgi:hypothetical protein